MPTDFMPIHQWGDAGGLLRALIDRALYRDVHWYRHRDAMLPEPTIIAVKLISGSRCEVVVEMGDGHRLTVNVMVSV